MNEAFKAQSDTSDIFGITFSYSSIDGQHNQVLGKYTKDAECIKKDILDNVNNIVQFMEIGPFNLIIGKYKEKLKQFEAHLETFAR